MPVQTDLVRGSSFSSYSLLGLPIYSLPHRHPFPGPVSRRMGFFLELQLPASLSQLGLLWGKLARKESEKYNGCFPFFFALQERLVLFPYAFDQRNMISFPVLTTSITAALSYNQGLSLDQKEKTNTENPLNIPAHSEAHLGSSSPFSC